MLLVGVAAALVPDTGGGHTAGTPAASPVTHSAKAAVSKAVWPPHGVPVTRKQLGAQWPFKGTTRGLVACVKDHPRAIIFNPGDGPELGKPFALNGTALDAGYRDIPRRIWLRDPAIPDPQARIDIGPLQALAPHGCEP